MRVVWELVGVGVCAFLAAFGTWFLVPLGEGSGCVVAELKPGWICIEDVGSLGEAICWVDARPRREWERNGVEGSVLLTDDAEEDFEGLMAEAFERFTECDAVVVYCSGTCESSEAVAEKVRELGLFAEGQVRVLEGGFRATFLR
ncbi:MAG: rhodanese-like domain-containing protein [Verrucomicrobiota bacterium]